MTESNTSKIGHITFDAKHAGERSAGNPHAAFDVAGAGNVIRSRLCGTRPQTRSELKVEQTLTPSNAPVSDPTLGDGGAVMRRCYPTCDMRLLK